MSEEGHVGDGPPHDSHELNQKPESQHEQGGETDEFDKDENEKDRENPGSGEEEKVSAQNPGYRSAGPDHGNGGARAREDLGESGKKTADQVEKEKAEMAQGVFDVIPEDPQIEHVPE